MKHLIYTILSITLFISCSKNEEIEAPQAINTSTDYSFENEKEIISYIAKHNLNAMKSKTGLYYVIDEAGTGKQPTSTSNVTVVYKGYLTNGIIFDQSSSKGLTVSLDKTIKGWTEGISYFKEGGSGILLIPAHLAYGSSNLGIISPGSVLIFDIKLISVNN